MLCRLLPYLLLLPLLTGCSTTRNRAPSASRFVFERDTLAFANELLWEYEIDAQTGKRKTRPREPEPEYHHHCFPMVEAVRQFYDFARFDPDQPRDNADRLNRQLATLLSINPRSDPARRERIVIRGYSGLRELSRENEALLKETIGGQWESWFQRGHWRMVFPFSRGHQAQEACELKAAIENGRVPIVHVVRFPALTINHALLLFAWEEEDGLTRFQAYDPNTPDQPLVLSFDPATRTFLLPATPYWQGGRVDVYEVFKNGIY